MHTHSRRARRAAFRLAAFSGATLGLAATALMPARAQTTFTASLTGAQEKPPNASFAFGSGLVVLNAAKNAITVDMSWTGLTSGAIAGHIHDPGGPGVAAPILFPFAGITNTLSGSLPEQTFAITPAQVSDLESGLMYFNIHTTVFPGGEIRGQILPAVPETSTTASFGLLLALGMGGVVIAARRKKTSVKAAA